MKTVGLIVEYNPLHNGHVYHFRQSKAVSGADAVVAVMSGHFLQRGEPAVVNKWARTEMAIKMGADLVIELPVAFSAQPAEWFAYGAVSALDATGVVDSLCFGSESGNIEWMLRLAERLSEPDDAFGHTLRAELKTGAPYPAAFAAAVERHVPGVDREQLAQPNNTLGLHYLIALERLGSPIRPLTVARLKAGYRQTDITDDRIASATAIRRLISRNLDAAEPYVPPYTMETLRREWEAGRGPVDWERLFRPLFVQLLSRSARELALLYEVSEGLEGRIKRALPLFQPEAPDPFERFIELIKTKRYTRTKLQRVLTRILLNHAKDELSPERLQSGVPYLCVLGFSEKGRILLKRMKTTARVPVILRAAEADHPLFELDVRATSMYALAYDRPSARDLFRDYYEPPVRLAHESER